MTDETRTHGEHSAVDDEPATNLCSLPVADDARKAVCDFMIPNQVPEQYRAAIMAGEWDGWPPLQAFAAHRRGMRDALERIAKIADEPRMNWSKTIGDIAKNAIAGLTEVQSPTSGFHEPDVSLKVRKAFDDGFEAGIDAETFMSRGLHSDKYHPPLTADEAWAKRLEATDARKAVPLSELIALLDDPKIAAAVRVPGEPRK